MTSAFARGVPSIVLALMLGAGVVWSGAARAELPADVKAKVETYKKKLVEWGANPAIVKAVKEANAKGGAIPGMTNAKWDELAANDPQVTALLGSAASKQVAQWEADKNISKLFVRDEKGNAVAASSKPLLFNNASRPPFKAAIKGEVYHADEVKPDPTTQVKSVQISAPVLDGGKPIGVIHSAVTAQ